MNQELREMFIADQAERDNHPAHDTPEYWQLRARDAARRQRVNELLAEGRLSAADDYYHAALIFQHGETLKEMWWRARTGSNSPPIFSPHGTGDPCGQCHAKKKIEWAQTTGVKMCRGAPDGRPQGSHPHTAQPPPLLYDGSSVSFARGVGQIVGW